MIPQDLISRMCRAHDKAVDAAVKVERNAQFGKDSPAYVEAFIRHQAAELKFEKAIAALADKG